MLRSRLRAAWRDAGRKAIACLLTVTGIGAVQRFSRIEAAETATALEYQVKAAFLLNFTKFIVWPSPEDGRQSQSFDICIVGEDHFGGVLDQMLEGETVGGRRLTIRRELHQPSSSCRVVYVGQEQKDASTILANIGPGVLTVGEGQTFIRGGGMIAFVVENHRVRFDISDSAASKSGLQVSSKLLRVARNVEK